MKKTIAMMALAALVMSGCSTSAPDAIAQNDLVSTSTPASTADPAAALQSTVTSLLADYYDADSITGVSVNNSAVIVQVTLPDSSGWEEAPEGWSDIITAATSASEALTAGCNADNSRHVALQLMDMDGNALLTVNDGRILQDKFAEASSAANPKTISLSEFNKIATGMTYDEVCAIIGGSGELLSDVDLGLGPEYRSQMYSWDGEGMLGANANVTFSGGDGVYATPHRLGGRLLGETATLPRPFQRVPRRLVHCSALLKVVCWSQVSHPARPVDPWWCSALGPSSST